MKYAVVQASTLQAAGTWNAKAIILLQQHEPLYRELMEKFTHEELVHLAKELPHDTEAAKCLMPHGGGWRGHWNGMPNFFAWLAGVKGGQQGNQRMYHLAAAYCAAAAQHAASKVLLQVEELTKQKKVLLEGLKGLLDKSQQAPLLNAAIKWQSSPQGTKETS